MHTQNSPRTSSQNSPRTRSRLVFYHAFTRLLVLIAAAALVALPLTAVAQNGATDDVKPQPGLLVEYRFGDSVIKRSDADVLFVGHSRTADSRLPATPFKANWQGSVLIRANGTYTLSLYAIGNATLHIDDQPIIVNETSTGWNDAKPIELSYGQHPIKITYDSPEPTFAHDMPASDRPASDRPASDRPASDRPASDRPASDIPGLGLYWSGPGFQLEPVGPRYLSHVPQGLKAHEVVDANDRGLALSRAYRCAACHEFPHGEGQDDILSAPSLLSLSDNLRPSWLVERLTAPPEANPTSKMPHFAMHRNDAMAISAALFNASKESEAPPDLAEQLKALNKKRKKNEAEIRLVPDADEGRTAFVSIGCIACHQVDELGNALDEDIALFSGTNLSKAAVKRTKNFVRRWLDDPSSVNRAHRMPVFDLQPIEAMDLAEYLVTLGADESQNDTRAAGDKNRGVGLIRKYRCGACHELPDSLQTQIERSRVDADDHWEAGCLGLPNGPTAIPGYALGAESRERLKQYLAAASTLSDPHGGSQVVKENNCLACHSRETAGGLAEQFPDLIEEMPDLASRLGAIAPPSLTSVGDKLHEMALRRAITGADKPRRPWLDVRMPKFDLDAVQQEAIIHHFISHDRIPDRDTEPLQVPGDKAADIAASRLVTAEGFGCQSCHQIADSEPLKVALNAHGTDLTMLGERIRSSWFDRWVRNPARIVPRMEMPAIQSHVAGVLGDSLDLQLAALWKTLNTPGYRPPKPNPIRVVRNFNALDLNEPTRILTDVLEIGEAVYLRPLVFGLPNRNNLMFDLESGSLKSWWLGDTARQHTRGKFWFWEAGGPPLLDKSSAEGPAFLERIAVVDSSGTKWSPTIVGQVAVELDRIEHEGDAAIWSGRINLSAGNRFRQVHFTQRLEPRGDAVAVQTQVSGLDPGEKLLVQFGGKAKESDDLTIEFGDVAICQMTSASCVLKRSSAEQIEVYPATEDSTTVRWTSNYRSRVAADHFPPNVFVLPPSMKRDLDCVPGYEAIRLPLPIPVMPISFAWSPEGEMFIGSLKGNILQAVDSDGDDLPDRYDAISDELPTPYGLHYGPEGLVALAKFGLVRLTKPTDAGTAWQTTVLADGWGYTSDYHDWAVGLEIDSQGNYYMALPCQQDDRSEAAAHLRGHALKLVPNSDSQAARSYRIESIAAGLRFPMGIALNGGGDLFTTDNQGNYNPFNELNHLRLGKRYGFINKLENKDGFSPPFESPAINLPHPWTRSVNGMCFLQTPAELRKSSYEPRFGRFEGHLIGCEMNNRALIRMTLQQVGDTFQGAAYLFSELPSDGKVGFEGPIVCDISPSGDLYVGNLVDSGWGGGQNTGSVVRLRPNGELPLGIAEVRASSTGLVVDFTEAVDATKALRRDNYSIRSYRRTATPAYGGDDEDERDEAIQQIRISEGGLRIELDLEDLRAGYVYELNVAAIGPNDENLFPSQAHYTMRAIPEE